MLKPEYDLSYNTELCLIIKNNIRLCHTVCHYNILHYIILCHLALNCVLL